jgi:putative membrane protein
MVIRDYKRKRNLTPEITLAQKTILYSLLGIYLLLQIIYPLIHGDILFRTTIATILVGSTLAFYHAALSQGSLTALAIIFVILIYSYLTELIGVHTHWPFGAYQYSNSLGYSLDKVPFIVPFAWVTVVYPCYIAMNKVLRNWRFLYGAIGLVVWDLFLDPLMVNAHRWSWAKNTRNIFFEKQIPLSNPFGWLLAGLGLMSILTLFSNASRRANPGIRAPYIVLLWSWFSGVIGNLFFFHNIALAICGGLLFGCFALPLIYKVSFSAIEL